METFKRSICVNIYGFRIFIDIHITPPLPNIITRFLVYFLKPIPLQSNKINAKILERKKLSHFLISTHNSLLFMQRIADVLDRIALHII